MRYLKSLPAAVVSVMLIASLGACGAQSNGQASSNAPQSSPQTSSAPEESKEAEKPSDLNGKWTQTNANSDSMRMDAEIADGTITVNWMQPDSTSLYWVGTYEAPTAAGDWSWTSKGDTEKMASALLASQDDAKEFHYTAASDELSFEASAMGTTVTVRMKRQ